MFTPSQIATMTRFPVGSSVTLGKDVNGPKVAVQKWTIYNGTLAFAHCGEDVPPTPADLIYENVPHSYTLVHGFDSEDNAIATDDYPYGRDRTSCRWWVETAVKGSQKGKQRFMQQTLNPKTQRWNKPHGSIYHDVQLIYVDQIGHVHNYPFDVFCGPDGLLKFIVTEMHAQLSSDEYDRLTKLVEAAKVVGINRQCWTRAAYLVGRARSIIGGGTDLNNSQVGEQIAREAKIKFPDDRFIYDSDVQLAISVACAELATGVKCELI